MTDEPIIKRRGGRTHTFDTREWGKDAPAASQPVETTFRERLKLEDIPLPEHGGFSHDILDPEFKLHRRLQYEDFRRMAEEDRFLICDRGAKDPDYRPELYELCKRDPVFFINHFIWTFDDRSEEGAVPMVLYPFQVSKLVEPYVRMCETLAPKRATVGVGKSRAVGFTWVSLALRVWRWMFFDNWSILIGGESRDDVDDGGINASQQSLFGKLRFMVNHLPRWMKIDKLGPLIDKEEFNKRMLLKNPMKPLNVIHGRQLGGMFGRSRRYSEVFADEVAWSEEMEEADTSLKQTTNRFFFGSTPKGKANFFYQAMFGELKLTRCWIWWAEMPHLDLEWYNDQREDMSDEQIAQELDLSFDRSAGGRVLHEVTLKEWFLPTAQYDPHLPLEVIIDPGFADHLACIWAQWDDINQQGRIVDFVQTNRKSIDWIVPFILGQVPEYTFRGDQWRHRYNEIEEQIIERHRRWDAPATVYGDKAGGATNIVTASSAWDELDGYGIFVAEIRIPNDKEALKHLELMMRHIKFWDGLVHQRNAHKSESPTMSEVVTQWRFPKKGKNAVQAPSKPVHDIHSHGGDCLKMWASERDVPDPSLLPSHAGGVLKNRSSGIVRNDYRSSFRS